MKAATIVALLCCAALLASATSVGSTNDKALFRMFKLKHNRQYASAAEEKKRFGIFQENMKSARKFQATNPLATFGINEFADVSAEEFKSHHNLDVYRAKHPKQQLPVDTRPVTMNNATQWDWRTKGAVTPIKNQGQCGSCWAFSAVANIEGQWFLAGNTLTSLSEQEIVSCDTTDDGCGGGDPIVAYQWLIASEAGVLATEASDPYQSGGGVAPGCTTTGTPGATIYSYVALTQSEYYMQAWTTTYGPISICIDATSFQTYTGGIMTNCQSLSVDHCVAIVGFDALNQPPYWIIKNSWGTSWGENGYIRVEMYTDQCLLTSEPNSALVHSAGPTPAPNTPPTPGAGTFTESKCTDFGCKNCETKTNPTGTCINSGSFSFTATCASDGIVFNYYTGSGCNGAVTQTIEPVNMCQIVQDFAGDYFSQLTCNAGPAPTTTPAPNSPPNPTPAPSSGGTFTQMNCVDSACSQGCSNNTFQQNVCIPVNGGGSALVTCIPGYLNFTEYATSTCSGPGQNSPMPLNQCLQGGEGSFENFCSSTASAVSISSKRVSKPQFPRRQ